MYCFDVLRFHLISNGMRCETIISKWEKMREETTINKTVLGEHAIVTNNLAKAKNRKKDSQSCCHIRVTEKLLLFFFRNVKSECSWKATIAQQTMKFENSNCEQQHQHSLLSSKCKTFFYYARLLVCWIIRSLWEKFQKKGKKNWQSNSNSLITKFGQNNVRDWLTNIMRFGWEENTEATDHDDN